MARRETGSTAEGSAERALRGGRYRRRGRVLRTGAARESAWLLTWRFPSNHTAAQQYIQELTTRVLSMDYLHVSPTS